MIQRRFTKPFTMLGLPTVRAQIVTKGRGGFIAARLWDVHRGEQVLVSRGVYRLRDNQHGSLLFQLFGNGWRFAAGTPQARAARQRPELPAHEQLQVQGQVLAYAGRPTGPVTEERANVGAVELVYETIGDPADPTILLVMGLGMQLIHWDLELCEGLAERGFQVIRFDNRDAGLSTKIDGPVPNVTKAMAGLPIKAPYLLQDMANDSFGLLDHLGIERAHVTGVSMGGMIAQTMAITRPERVLSLGSMLSTTGDRRVGTRSCACGAC